MKKVVFISLFLSIANIVFGQILDPVEWSFTSKKIKDGYELILTATMKPGWHIYSQNTPQGGPVATKINFTKNPLVLMLGNITEQGKMEQHNEPLFGVMVKQYSNKINFVQLVKMKAAVNTSVTGSLLYMACNSTKCLPPKTVPFSIPLK